MLLGWDCYQDPTGADLRLPNFTEMIELRRSLSRFISLNYTKQLK